MSLEQQVIGLMRGMETFAENLGKEFLTVLLSE